MSFGPPTSPHGDIVAPEAPTTGLRLPLAWPVMTYVLLAIIVLVFVADVVLRQLTGYRVVFALGAQSNELIAAGEYWRLVTPIFLHASLTHLAFNAYALFILGRDTEAFYGTVWFTVIYFTAGIAGSVAWYILGTTVPSVGASGAIFGLIGAEAAFFVLNRRLFGAYARQRLGNVAVLLVINLVFGFTSPNINNLAHLGGLVAGFLLGLALSPSYTVGLSQEGFSPAPRLIDNRTSGQRLFTVLVAVVVLLGLVWLGNQRWAV